MHRLLGPNLHNPAGTIGTLLYLMDRGYTQVLLGFSSAVKPHAALDIRFDEEKSSLSNHESINYKQRMPDWPKKSLVHQTKPGLKALPHLKHKDGYRSWRCSCSPRRGRRRYFSTTNRLLSRKVVALKQKVGRSEQGIKRVLSTLSGQRPKAPLMELQNRPLFEEPPSE